MSFQIAFLSKLEKSRIFSHVPKTRVLKFCPELEAMVIAKTCNTAF